MKYSECCHAELTKEFVVDRYQCDDDYELKVPAYRCSKCEQLFLPIFSQQFDHKPPYLDRKIS